MAKKKTLEECEQKELGLFLFKEQWYPVFRCLCWIIPFCIHVLNLATSSFIKQVPLQFTLAVSIVGIFIGLCMFIVTTEKVWIKVIGGILFIFIQISPYFLLTLFAD